MGKWINYTAQAQGKTNCIICASGRPCLTTAPARITPFNSAKGICMLIRIVRRRPYQRLYK